MKRPLLVTLLLFVLAAASAQDIDNLFRNDISKEARKNRWEVVDSIETRVTYKIGNRSTATYFFDHNQVYRVVHYWRNFKDPREKERFSSEIKVFAWMDGYIFKSMVIPKDNQTIFKASKPNHELSIKDYSRHVVVDVRLINTRYND